jgi:hypothetical protein
LDEEGLPPPLLFAYGQQQHRRAIKFCEIEGNSRIRKREEKHDELKKEMGN